MVAETKADIRNSCLKGKAPIVGHSGDGNFHCFLVYDSGDPEEVKAMKGLASRMSHRAQDLGGTCTGEHGIGSGKRKALAREAGSGSIAMMKAIKSAVDPHGRLNPGKVV